MTDNQSMLLSYATQLPIEALFSGQDANILEDTHQLLVILLREIRRDNLSAPEMVDPLEAESALFRNKVQSVQDLHRASAKAHQAWRNRDRESRPQLSPGTDLSTEQKGLLGQAEGLWDRVRRSCQERVLEAEHAMESLRAITTKLADMRLVIDRRAIPSGRHVFLSYAHEDQAVARAIDIRLRSAGVDTWLDEHSLAGGALMPVEIARAISRATHFCAIISAHSRNSSWVEHEVSLALSHEIEHGSPQLIPLLLDGGPLPEYFADHRGISFQQFHQGMPQLWSALGVPERANWSLTEVGTLLRRGARLLGAVKWCDQADSFMTVQADTFEELEEMERYLINIGLSPRRAPYLRFARTRITYHADSAEASFDDEFYTYNMCYLGGTVLLQEFTALANELSQPISGNRN